MAVHDSVLHSSATEALSGTSALLWRCPPMRDDVDLFEQLMDSVSCKCRMTDVVFSLADGRQARLNETPERGRR